MKFPFGWRGLLLIASPLSFVALVAAHVGWFGSPLPWEAATGWNDVASADRPTGSLPDEIELAWLGHSGFVLRFERQTLLLDPNTSSQCTVAQRVLEPAIDPGTLGRIDAVLISHAHFDHLDLATLEALGDVGRIVVPAGSEEFLPAPPQVHGERTPLQLGESVVLGGLTVTAVPAVHNGHRFHPLHSTHLAVGYVIRGRDLAIYFAGDTGASNDFAAIRDAHHPQIAILPIGAYAPRFPMRRYHLSPEDAVDAAIDLGVQTVVPCHFGTFALALDRPAAALPRFARDARARGVAWIMPALLTPTAESAP